MDDPTTQKSLPEVDQQPVIGVSSAPVQSGNTVERSSAIFSEHSTSNMSLTSNISPASHTTKPNEVFEPLGIVIDHILSKSRYCDTNDVLGVAAIVEKLRWHTSRGHELPNNTDTQHCEFIQSLQNLAELMAALQGISNPSLPILLSEEVIIQVVLTAMRYPQEHIESLTFEPQELEVLSRWMSVAMCRCSPDLFGLFG
jgi:hypothetical protein